jgi:hypothetical protein
MRELLERVQQNAQAGVPVIPNNGNPRGANNMPGQPTIPQPQGNAWGNRYSWLAPSPSMNRVQQLLAQPLIQPPTSPIPMTPDMPGANEGLPPGILPVNNIPTPVTTPVLPRAAAKNQALGVPSIQNPLLPQRANTLNRYP